MIVGLVGKIHLMVIARFEAGESGGRKYRGCVLKYSRCVLKYSRCVLKYSRYVLKYSRYVLKCSRYVLGATHFGSASHLWSHL